MVKTQEHGFVPVSISVSEFMCVSYPEACVLCGTPWRGRTSWSGSRRSAPTRTSTSRGKTGSETWSSPEDQG